MNAADRIECNPLRSHFHRSWRRLRVMTANYNSINHYLDMAELAPYLQYLITRSALPLKALETQFAVDASGFSTCEYVRWFDEKYGKG
jgi:hypothetical protein